MQDTLPQAKRKVNAGQRRILLVDDDAISLEILAMMLCRDGHEVLQAPDGEAALDLLSAADANPSPDVLLVDMQMPGVSGREFAEKVKAMQGPKPRLLAMSATVVNNRKLRGFDGFLLKPLAIDDLRRALDPKPAAAKRHSRLRSALPRSGKPLRAGKTAPEAEPNIDQAMLSKLSRAMPRQAIHELFEACITDTRKRVPALEEHVRAGQTDELRRGAHQIKGAASMIGALRLVRLATILEFGSCKEEDSLRLLADLLDACKDLQRILQAGKLQITNEHSNDNSNC